MADEQNLFILLDEFISRYQRDKSYNIVIWGTGEVAAEVYQTLTAFSVQIKGFGDNSDTIKGKLCYSRPILTAEEVASLHKPLIIIGSFVVRPIWEQLHKLGLTDIYVIIDTMKYSFKELEEEKRLYRKEEDYTVESKDILIEAYGNIGDIVLKGGMLNFFIRRFGKEHVYILVETESLASFVSLFTNQVYVGGKQQVREDADFRRELLNSLNRRRFQTSYILADIRLHFTRRYLNQYNFNVKDIRFHTCLPDKEYLPEMDAAMVRDIFSLSKEHQLGAKGCLKDYINSLPAVTGLPEQFVAVNMGATKKIRHYDVKKAAIVVDYLIQRGFTVVMLGNGSYDEEYYKQLTLLLPNQSKFISFISALSLLESFYVILKSVFFVGTDSGMWNVSYILEKQSVVIYGGGEEGCFQHDDTNVHYAMTERMECFGCKWFCTQMTNQGYAKCIDNITPSMIISKIKEIIGE